MSKQTKKPRGDHQTGKRPLYLDGGAMPISREEFRREQEERYGKLPEPTPEDLAILKREARKHGSTLFPD